MFSRDHKQSFVWPWASSQIRKIAGCACTGNAGNVFTRHRRQGKPLISDPDMHHGTCVTHVPWCMSGSLTRGGGENVPGIPGACATRKFTYLARGPWSYKRLLVVSGKHKEFPPMQFRSSPMYMSFSQSTKLVTPSTTSSIWLDSSLIAVHKQCYR